ncbi:hypothetical protein ABG067_007569 [Albugo candida]
MSIICTLNGCVIRHKAMMQDIRSYFTTGQKPRKKQRIASEETITTITDVVKKSSSLDEPQHNSSDDVTYHALASCLEDLMHPTWYALLEFECQKDYFRKLLEFLRSETAKSVSLRLTTL